jgi:hypothetical protein
MRMQSLPILFLLISWIFIPAGADSAPGAATSANPGSIPGLLFSTVLANLFISVTIVLMCIFGLYAYASLARFAPYHSWIYLYLVSLTGIVWALFLMNNGGSLSDATFILTTVVGINLIVHVLRFDRIEIPSIGQRVCVEIQSG